MSNRNRRLLAGYAGFTSIFLLLIAGGILAIRSAPAAERDYQLAWCAEHGGEVEHVLEDRTRVDCLTATHAIEFDFATKWAEAIGQSMHYSRLTHRRAGIVLIVGPGDERYVERVRADVAGLCLPIDVWTVPR
jgi:hypothetical protein